MLSSESSGAWTERSSAGNGKIGKIVRFELLMPHTDFLAPSMRAPPESPSRVPPYVKTPKSLMMGSFESYELAIRFHPSLVAELRIPMLPLATVNERNP